MRVAYVAGPYRSVEARSGGAMMLEIIDHIDLARVVALELWGMGYAVICPHLNTCLMELNEDHVLKAYLEIVRRCDLLVRIPGWNASQGTLAEIAEAEGRSLPVFTWPDDRATLRSVALDEALR